MDDKDRDEALRMYLREVSQAPLLSDGEDRRLVDEARKAGPARLDAKRSVVEANLRLVVSVAKTYQTTTHHLVGVIQEGNLALIRAVEQFDTSSRESFSEFATRLIRDALSETFGEPDR